MTTVAVDRLKETRLKAWNDMRALLDAARTEGRAMTGEETQRYTLLEGEMKSCGDTIDAELRAAKIADFMAAPAPTVGVPQGEPVNSEAQRSEEHEKAFAEYIRRGSAHMRGETREVLDKHEFRDTVNGMGEASNSIGGYLVPPGFLAKITETLKFFGGVRLVANVIETTSGQSLVWPSNDDTGNPATIIGENTQVSEVDLALGQRTLSSYLWTTGAVRIGRALMQDSAFDLESLVADRFGKRLGRGQNTAFTTGVGISGGLAGVTVGVTGASTVDPLVAAAAGDGIPMGHLLDLIHSVDAAYRQGGACVWMMNDTSVGKIQKLVDSTGRPLFIPAGSFGSIATGAATKNLDLGGGVDTLLGYPIVVNNDCDNSDATNDSGDFPVFFGDFKRGYIVRDVTASMATLRLEERYADYGQVGFIGYLRSDGNLDDLAAIRALTLHA
jgi:HK97 family phage major capsid protein